jgi:hypothetical protein
MKLPRKLKKRRRSTLRQLRRAELREERATSNGLYIIEGVFARAMRVYIERGKESVLRSLYAHLYGTPMPSRLHGRRFRRRKRKVNHYDFRSEVV